MFTILLCIIFKLKNKGTVQTPLTEIKDKISDEIGKLNSKLKPSQSVCHQSVQPALTGDHSWVAYTEGIFSQVWQLKVQDPKAVGVSVQTGLSLRLAAAACPLCPHTAFLCTHLVSKHVSWCLSLSCQIRTPAYDTINLHFLPKTPISKYSQIAEI